MSAVRNLYSKQEVPRPVVNIAAARQLAQAWIKPATGADSSIFFPKGYDTPPHLDMAVVMVFFNPSFSVRNIQAILMSKHFIESSGIPLYIGELAFDETPFLFAPAGNIFQYRSTSYMHYSANLIATIESRIPSTFKKLCVLDAEIIFREANWYSVISAALNSHDVCQPFRKTSILGINFRELKCMTNALDSEDYDIDLETEQPGHAWAFNRRWYKAAEISDLTVSGAASLNFLYSVKDIELYDHPFVNTYNGVYKSVHANTCSVDLTIYQLFRGANQNGSCLNGFAKLCNGKSIKSLITRREDNIIEWAPKYKAKMNSYMQAYFNKRFDDSATLPPITSLKFYPEPYETPTTRDMAVILVFFNPNPYIRIMQNILMVKHTLDSAKIPYFIAELAFEDKPFLFSPAAHIFQYRSNSYMFYKENLIRVLEPQIPNTFTKICILDADILFDRRNWYSIISNTLNNVTICQPFKRAYWMNLEYKTVKERGNSVDSTDPQINWPKEHPGFVWAFNRSWEGLKLYLNINIPTIGGDTILLHLIRRNITNLNTLYNLDKIERPPCDSANLSVYHLNHGTIHKRQYIDIITITKKILEKHRKNSVEELVYNRVDGIMEWYDDYAPDMNHLMIKYFADRSEDDEDIELQPP